MKNKALKISIVKNTIQSFDLDTCNLLAKWLDEHIKLLELDTTLYHKNIKQLGLSNRTYNVLMTNNIHSIQQLICIFNWNDVKKLKGAGEAVEQEIRQKIMEIQGSVTISK